MPDLAAAASVLQLSEPAKLLRKRLVFGTAQLTQAYGVFADVSHRDDGAALLDAAVGCGFGSFDTAPGYGNAERVVGGMLRRHRHLDVITKTLHIRPDALASEKIELIRKSASQSLQALGLTRIPVLLLHSPAAFDATVARALDGLRSAGVVDRVGVSVYAGEEIDRICSAWRPDVVQLPLNLFDQRLLVSGHLKALRRMGCEIHARSAFLQGVLLAPAESLPIWLAELGETLHRLDRSVGRGILDRAAACLGFLASLDVDRVIVGAQNCGQLRELMDAVDMARCPVEPSQFAVADASLIDPRGWPQ